ncbi:MAG: hypothetical protein NTW30_06090 [Candidatus Aenigmarchaeota archaeon]|nr:hypothetical protein [Candidatus Aenigmarchaeota archaeon]
MKDWKNMFPLDVYSGETKKELVTLIEHLLEEERERIFSNIGFLRQWLNEDRITDYNKMVTNDELKHWLK